MFKLGKCLLLGAGLAVAASAAQATTVSGIIEENGPSGYYSGLTADHTFGDFNNGTATPLLTAVGDFTIYGSVTHESSTNFLDSWTMDFTGGFYSLDLAWQNVGPAELDFQICVQSAGGTATGITGGCGALTSVAGGSGTQPLAGIGSVTGLWTISIDPIFGTAPVGEIMNWQLSGALTPAPIPLPASALLLLAGLGGLGVMRRRKTAA